MATPKGSIPVTVGTFEAWEVGGAIPLGGGDTMGGGATTQEITRGAPAVSLVIPCSACACVHTGQMRKMVEAAGD